MAGMVFPCSHCGSSVASDDSLCGQVATCPDCGKDVVVPIPGLESGMEVGDFKLLEPLGSGAMGEVWLAEQTSMDRKVALKVLFPHLTSDKRFVDRFLKEVRNSAKLSHPNIVTAFHAGTDKGMHYLAISFVKGRTIGDILEEDGVFEEEKALRVILDIASALEYAWNEFKILHRDIKPANIIINDKGVPMLLDMGISKSVDDDVSLTMTGTVIGTPHYMSPEQAVASEDLDFRSDMYSLGTTLYHMLTGVVPFESTTAMAVIMRHINEEFPPIREKNPKVSVNCEALIDLMTDKKRERRPQSWAALREALQTVLAGNAPRKPPAEPAGKEGRAASGGEVAPNDATVLADSPSVPPSGASVSYGDGDGVEDSPEAVSTTGDDADKKKIMLLAAVFIGLAILFLVAVSIVLFLFFRGGAEREDAAAKTVSPSSATVSATTEKGVRNGNPAGASSASASSATSTENPGGGGGGGGAPADELSMAFAKYADNLDLTKNTELATKTFWPKSVGSRHTWKGKVAYVKGGLWKAEVRMACPGRMLYKGFNVILVTSDKASAAKLKIGQEVTFKGEIYSYKHKWSGLVIVYMKNVTFIGLDGSGDE